MSSKKSPKKKHSSCRYHPFPLPPTFEQYKTQRPQWDELKHRLSRYQNMYKAEEFKECVTSELQDIKKERDAFIQQARNKSSWEAGTADDTFQNTLECVADEECKEKQGYCLTIGRTHLFMCKKHFDTLDLETDDLFLVNLYEKMPGMWDRAQHPNNWVKKEYESESDHTSIEDILCRDTDNCWFRGNTDRLSHYSYSYRLKGTDDIYLCDVCWDNRFSDDMISVIEDIDLND